MLSFQIKVLVCDIIFCDGEKKKREERGARNMKYLICVKCAWRHYCIIGKIGGDGWLH